MTNAHGIKTVKEIFTVLLAESCRQMSHPLMVSDGKSMGCRGHTAYEPLLQPNRHACENCTCLCLQNYFLETRSTERIVKRVSSVLSMILVTCYSLYLYVAEA